MKKVGTITESRMTKPAESKSYPLVSDALFGGKVKIDENASKGYPKQGVKGGTKAAAKIAKAKKVGKAKLLKDADKVLSLGQTATPSQKGGRSMSSYASQQGNTEDEDNEKVYNSMTDAKDPDWIQDAEKDIERRGTEGKCTPITKKGCTGRAKALAKTFKKMAKRKKKNEAFEPGSSDGNGSSNGKGASGNVGTNTQALADKTMDDKEQSDLAKKRAEWRKSLRPTGDDGGAQAARDNSNTTSK